MGRVGFYFKFVLISLWLIFTTLVYVPISLVRRKSLNNDRDIGRMMSWGVQRIAGMRIVVEGEEYKHAVQPTIYVANHQSAMDVGTFGWICPDRTLIIGKKELIWVPFFGVLFWAAGNVMIDRHNRTRAVAGLSEVVEAIRRRGANVIIFPEGTRNRSGEGMLPFKKGAFYMAIEAQVPITPILCSPIAPIVNSKAGKLLPGTVRFRFLPPVSTQGLTIEDVPALRDRVRDLMLAELKTLQTTLH